MRRLSGFYFVLCLGCIFSLQANAMEYSHLRPQPAGKPANAGNTQYGQVLYTQRVEPGTVTQQAQYANNQGSGRTGGDTDGGQQLKQFAQQTQAEFSSFEKI